MKESRLNQVFTLILLVAVLAVGWQLRSWGDTSEMDGYREQIEQYQEDIAAVTAYAAWLQDSNAILLDSVKTVEEHAAVLETKVDTLVKINEDIQHEVDSLQHEFASIDPTLIPPPVLEYIDALETQVDTLKTTVATQRNLISVKDTDIRLWQGLYGNEKERADSLQITLNSFPGSVPNTDKLFGFIPLPSRTVSFISGAAAATVGFIALTR